MINHVIASNMEYVTQYYSSAHRGIDIVKKGSSGDDVIAYDNGTIEIVVSNVRYTNHNTKGNDTYGNYIKIKHPNGKSTLYGHLKYGSIVVRPGQAVVKGQKLASMGATGNAYGVHLHFEVRNVNNVRENPIYYLNGKKSFDIGNSSNAEQSASVSVVKSTNQDNAPNNTSNVKSESEKIVEKHDDNSSFKSDNESKSVDNSKEESILEGKSLESKETASDDKSKDESKSLEKEETKTIDDLEESKEDVSEEIKEEEDLNDADEISNGASIDNSESFTYSSDYDAPKIHGLKDTSKKEKSDDKKSKKMSVTIKRSNKSKIKLKGFVKKSNDNTFVNENRYSGNSLVDGLKSEGEDSSFESRKAIARANGIENYSGTSSENIYLLDLLKCNLLERV